MVIRTKLLIAGKQHEAIFQELLAVLAKRGDELTPPEQLAIMSNIVGKLIAMQDQRELSPDEAMEIVIKNLELGNQQVISQIGNTKGEA